MMLAGTVSAPASDLSYTNHEVLNSLMVQHAVAAAPCLPTQISLTSEGLWGDKKLVELGALQDDWDGYGGAAIDKSIILASREYFALLLANLPAPDIQPNPNGTISFEWTPRDGAAQLEIGKTHLSLYIKHPSGSPIFWTAESTVPVVARIGRLIASTLYAKQHTDMTVPAWFGSQRDWAAA